MSEKLEVQIALLTERQLQHERRQAADEVLLKEFMLRADQRLEFCVKKLEEWATIRRTLAWIAGGLISVGAGLWAVGSWLADRVWTHHGGG